MLSVLLEIVTSHCAKLLSLLVIGRCFGMDWKAGFFCLSLFLSLGFTNYDPERKHLPGVLVPALPVQNEAEGLRPWKKNDHLVRPLARFEMKARVLLTDRYRFGREAKLSPVDLTLGWGPMSDTAVLDTLTLSHSHRYYSWRAKSLVLPVEEINRHAANMHMVPADANIERRLKEVIRGDIVEIEGYLVELASPDGWSWRSSLTRDDSGMGACEIVWVERISIKK